MLSAGFQVSGFRGRVQDNPAFRVSGFGFKVLDFGFRLPGFEFRISGMRWRVSEVEVAGYPGRRWLAGHYREAKRRRTWYLWFVE